MHKNLKALLYGLPTLFILYYAENWLTGQFGILSTSTFLGFIVIGAITIFGLFYVLRRFKAEPLI